MPFRLTNSPVNFMRLMDDILRPLTNSFMVVYLDDILIFNKSWEESLQPIRQVLQTLRHYKLCANLEKCTFGMSQVQYLGYIIDEHGVHVDPTKIQVIEVNEGRAKEKFSLSDSQQKVFIELKYHLFSPPILTLLDMKQPFEIETYASNYAIGAILTQHRHSMAYHSEIPSDAIQKYPTYDKDMYSIV
eukprot:PITA_08143